MNAKKLSEIIENHRKWLNDEQGGSHANLSRANLSRANLSGANLSRANLSSSDLSGADLSGANLSRADLSSSDLSGANLSGADLGSSDLSGANLSGADLSSSDLSGANLSGANLSGANLSGAYLSGAYLSGAYLSGAKELSILVGSILSITPEGEFFGWKKCSGGTIVKLLIPKEARRSNASGRKCRAEFVEVVEVFGEEPALSKYDGKTLYKTGERVHCDLWDDDRWNECSGGIHFFLTREEAEAF